MMHKSEEEYRYFFCRSLVGMGIAFASGTVVSCNRAMETITGYSLKELKQINLSDTYENSEERKMVVEELNRHGILVNFPVRLKRKGGTPYDALLSISRFKYNRGEDLFRTICIDVTEWKQALLESEAKYRAFAENTTDLIIRFDRQYRILYVNPYVATLFMVEPEDLLGKTHRELEYAGAMCHYLEENIRKVFDTGLPCGKVLQFDGKAGRKIFDWQLFPEFSADLRVESVVSIAQDITKQKEIEQELRERERECKIKARDLEEINTALKVLLSKMDEKRKELEESILLNVRDLVMPYLEKLKKSGLDETQKAYANIVESSLNDVISPFSLKLSSVYLKFTPAEIQVADLVRHGKTTKDIAELLHLSSKTIEVYRKNIRRKLGIKNKEANLRSHLLSIH